MAYESITESTLKSLQSVGAIRACTLLTLAGDGGYALSFAVSGISGGAMVLKSHREPVRVFKNPAVAFRLAASLGFDDISVALVPVELSALLVKPDSPEYLSFCKRLGLKPGAVAEQQYQTFLLNGDLFGVDSQGADLPDDPVRELGNHRTERKPTNLTGVSRQADPNAPDDKKRAAARAKRKKSKR
jgi:hypothetical protein